MHKKGVTLIELIVVLVLMLIIATAAAVKLGTYDTIKLNAAARKLVSDIRYTQMHAILSGEFSCVSFSPENCWQQGWNEYHSYRIFWNGLWDYEILIDPLTKGTLGVCYTGIDLDPPDGDYTDPDEVPPDSVLTGVILKYPRCPDSCAGGEGGDCSLDVPKCCLKFDQFGAPASQISGPKDAPVITKITQPFVVELEYPRCSGRKKTITIEPETGRVSLQ